MAKIEREHIQILRDQTGCGLMDCKKALEEADGSLEKAVEILRKKGAVVASKRAGKETAEGLIKTYMHPGDRLGVMVEINCETDFVARTAELSQLASDICMHIAAANPLYLNPEEVDPKLLERERDLLKEQLANSGKPAKIIDQIIEGKINKLYSDICLIEQTFVKNDQLVIKDLLQTLIAKTGENIRIKRFCRFEIGN